MSECLILNDQGEAVMNVSEAIAACLRAQDHGHPPVICYEVDDGKRKMPESMGSAEQTAVSD